MSAEPQGWHIQAGAPSWDAASESFSFFLSKPGEGRVPCTVTVDVLKQAVQSDDLSGPNLVKIFDAHRQMIELRAAQKLNAGQRAADGSIRVDVDDI